MTALEDELRRFKRLERELLRLYVEAEDLVDVHYNAEQFPSLSRRELTPEERVGLHKFEFVHLIEKDAVVSDMLWRLCLVDRDTPRT